MEGNVKRRRRTQNDAKDKPAESTVSHKPVDVQVLWRDAKKKPNEDNNTGVNHFVLPAPQETDYLIYVLAAMFYFACAINYSHKVLTACHEQSYGPLKGFPRFPASSTWLATGFIWWHWWFMMIWWVLQYKLVLVRRFSVLQPSRTQMMIHIYDTAGKKWHKTDYRANRVLFWRDVIKDGEATHSTQSWSLMRLTRENTRPK